MINYCLVLLFQTTTTTTGNFTLDWKWQLKSIINSWMDCASRETHPNETRIAPTPFTAKLKSWSFSWNQYNFSWKEFFVAQLNFFRQIDFFLFYIFFENLTLSRKNCLKTFFSWKRFFTFEITSQWFHEIFFSYLLFQFHIFLNFWRRSTDLRPFSGLLGCTYIVVEWDSVIFQGETNSPNQSPIILFL